jgi:RimJ/RimL family protein N-acetyltransferase
MRTVADPFLPGALELPEQLVGARIVLRPFERAEAASLFAAIDESREHVRPWLPWADEHRNIEETLAFIAGQRAEWTGRTGFGVGIFDRADRRILGGSGLGVRSWKARHFEVGYWLRPDVTGRGYVREAVALLARFGFEQLGANRITLHCDADNDRSRRAAEASGFVYEGCHRRDSLTPLGQLRDTLTFRLLREEYEAVLPGWRGFFAE